MFPPPQLLSPSPPPSPIHLSTTPMLPSTAPPLSIPTTTITNPSLHHPHACLHSISSLHPPTTSTIFHSLHPTHHYYHHHHRLSPITSIILPVLKFA
ncbi:hypothetical protein Pcinc_043609 [Petrolisthes cinctipes]|uniref:Uncharacterized protein n=1 Tax=Petrolisthes cinctipes TaxID=88211 RepID=A0AAE1BIU0_PETCI|nr:hypothetical protein Pcinc_043609 [Petrolisthes cinctipes]